MYLQFNGSALRLARLFNELALEDVAQEVGKTRQYLHKLEHGNSDPSFDLVAAFAALLKVRREFFYQSGEMLAEEAVHFRKLFTARVPVKHFALAKAEVFRRFVRIMEDELELPTLRIPSINVNNLEEVEGAANACRREWGIGLGPIENVIRLAENIGAVVTTFPSIGREVDALSISGGRPLIARNMGKESPTRQRFDVAHELGHAVLHQGVQTGDRVTEEQANRFASALLVPRSMMLKFFPKPRRSQLDWRAISEFKLTWRMSKAALLYRAWQLELISDQQYRSGVIQLNRKGEAVREREDVDIPFEQPEVISTGLDVLRTRRGMTLANIADAMHVQLDWLTSFAGVSSGESSAENVVPLRRIVA